MASGVTEMLMGTEDHRAVHLSMKMRQRQNWIFKNRSERHGFSKGKVCVSENINWRGYENGRVTDHKDRIFGADEEIIY